MAPYLVLFEGPFPTYSLLALAGRRLPGGTSTGGSGAGGETRPDGAGLPLGGCWEPWWGPSSSTCCPSWRLTSPCWGRTPPCSPPGTSPGVRVLRGAAGGLGGGGALLPKRRELPFGPLGADLVPAVPLFHAFGRVGCFLAGCCYGIPRPGGVVG